MAIDITSSDDLPFVARDGAGERLDWHPQRLAMPSEASQRGRDYVAALAALARVDEHAAWAAAQAVLLARTWDAQCWEEEGFSDALARAAVVGWRAMAHARQLPFDTHFDPLSAEYRSLHQRVMLMEAQLKALKQKPWRTFEEAGMG
jgi:hypothetical protein